MIRNNQAQRILRSAAFSAGLLLMIDPAAMAGTSADRAQEQHACAVILRLDQSEAGYDACIRSLERSLSAAQQQGDESAACAYIGLGSTAPCATDLRATLWNEENIGAR
jgi:hypothetical protein